MRMNKLSMAVISARCEDGALFYIRGGASGGCWGDLESATIMPLEVAERLVSMKRKQIQMQRDGERWLYGVRARQLAIES